MSRKRKHGLRRSEAGTTVSPADSSPPIRIPRSVWILCAVSGVALVMSIAWTLQPRPVDVTLLLAEAKSALESGDAARAGSALDAILKAEPTHGLALLYRGQMANSRDDLAKAMSDWSRIPDEPPQTGGTARYLEATIHLKLHQARAAEQKLLRSTELNPAYLQPHERLLELYVLQMRRREILEQLEAIRQLRRLSLQEMVLQLVAGQRIQTVENGIALTEQFVATDPDDIASWMALAQYYVDAERSDSGLEALRKVLANHPSDDGVRGLLAELLLRNAGTEEAQVLLSGHEPTAGSPAWLWKSVGELAVTRGDVERAVQCFRRVVEQNPDDLAARYRLGSLLARAGLTVDSQRYLEETVLLDRLQRQVMIVARGTNESAETFLPLLKEAGDILVRLGRAKQARPWYELAVAARPDDRETQRKLAAVDQLLAQSAPQDRNQKTGQSTASTGQPVLPESAASVADARPTATPVSPGNPAETGPSPIRLIDAHEEVGLDYRYFNGQTGFKYLIESMGGGVTVLDMDSDGWPDLYFPQGCKLPFDPEDHSHLDRLYRNAGNGQFLDITNSAGLDENRYSLGAAAGDLDNDGFTDVVVANYGRNTVYHNNGDGTFTDITPQTGILREHMNTSVALADLNRDGNLDLYVVNYVDSLRVCRNPQGRISTCDPNNFNAEQDRLYGSRGDGTFEDLTDTAGIVAPDGKGLGIVVADLDDDGWDDIYVANDGTPNFLFRNTTGESSETEVTGGPSIGPRFVEQGLISGVALSGDGQAQAGMGIACADLNEDLKLDLFVTNFYLESSTLYLNQGGGVFVDSTRAGGLTAPTRLMLGFGTQPVDFDLNGRPDLFVANGHIDDHKEQNIPWKMPPQLFENGGSGRFREVSAIAGPYFEGKYLGRGVARLDWNRDGRPDLAVVHQDAPAALLTNQTVTPSHFVVIELHGRESNRDAVGARVKITASGRTQRVDWCGGDGFCATNEKRQFVGVGSATQLDQLEIVWPSEMTARWQDLPTNCRLVIVEGSDPEVRPVAQ